MANRWKFSGQRDEVFKGIKFADSWSRHGIKPPFLLDFTNMDYDVQSGANQIRGFSNVPSVGLSSPVTLAVKHQSAAGVKTTLVAEGTDLYTHDGTTATSVKSGLTSAFSNLFRHAQFAFNKLMTNGVDAILEYSGGATAYEVGNPAPNQSATTATEGGGGVIDQGTYYYQITFVNDSDIDNESNADPLGGIGEANEIQVVLGFGNHEVDLASIPTGSANNNCTDRRIYRTQKGGTVFFLVGSIGNNTDTTFVDNVDDADLTLTSSPPTDHLSALVAAHDIAVFFGHTFTVGIGADQNKLYWSIQSQPDLRGSLNVKVFNSDIRMIQVFEDFLYIWEENGITRCTFDAIYSGVTGTITDTSGAVAFSFKEVTNEVGGYAFGKAVTNVPGGCIFLDESGYINKFNGWTVQRMIEDRWMAYADALPNPYVSMQFFQARNKIIFCMASASVNNRKLWQYDLVHDSLGEIVMSAGSGLANVVGTGHNITANVAVEPLWLGQFDGGLAQMGGAKVYTNMGSAITSVVETGWLDFGFAEEEKQIEKLILVVGSAYQQNDTADNTITFQIYISPDDDSESQTDDLIVGGSFKLPTATDPVIVFHEVEGMAGRMVRSIRVRLTHSTSGRTWSFHDVIITGMVAKGNEGN